MRPDGNPREAICRRWWAAKVPLYHAQALRRMELRYREHRRGGHQDFIRTHRRAGVRLNHMSVIISAYYKAVLRNPKLS